MFEIRERAAAGRIGRLTTRHGTVTTPTLLPVINPNLNILDATEMRRRFGVQMVITNSYIIRKKESLRRQALDKGVHDVLGWDGPVMTDSGTFQSYVYGDVDVTPEEIVAFQRDIGADVGTALDVFTVPETGHQQAAEELQETTRRVEAAAGEKGDMLLAGTVQGGVFADLRTESARQLAATDADVHPIGGVVPLMEQARYAELARVVLAGKRGLPSGRPVHLFGAGHPLVFPLAVALGCDLFDSASYAKYAKGGRMIFPGGTRTLDELSELACPCAACARWKDASELRRAPEDERLRALTEHNLAVSMAEIRRVRQAVRDGDLWELVEARAAENPALADALAVLREPEHIHQLEKSEPISSTRALRYVGGHTVSRPAIGRLYARLSQRWQPSADRCVLLPPRTKPYGEAYVAYLGPLAEEDAVVETPLGPVPLEFERMWPVAQHVFPETVDADTERVRDAFRDVFFRKFQGCDVFPFDADEYGPAAPTDAVRDAFDAKRARAVARYQFGVAAGDALVAGPLTFRRSPTNRSVRNVLAGGVHVASLRATDGLFSLRYEGGQRILETTESPRHRVVVAADAVPFVAEGKNPMAVGVRAADPELRPGDECLIVGPDDGLVAVGRMHVSGWEVASLTRGAAARTRGRADEDD